MKLYAIEHPDGGRWWDIIESVWADELHPLSLLSDADLAKRLAATRGGTVVEFTLTRTPELRVGARVALRGDVGHVTHEPWMATWPNRDTGEEESTQLVEIEGEVWPVEDVLLVLPEEDA